MEWRAAIMPLGTAALIGGALGLGNAIMGAKNASDQNKEAARRDALNAQLDANATRFQAFGHGDANGKLKPMDRASVLGNAIGGGLAGVAQGQNIAGSMANNNAYQKLLGSLSGKKDDSEFDVNEK
jgi:hypothetical protein